MADPSSTPPRPPHAGRAALFVGVLALGLVVACWGSDPIGRIVGQFCPVGPASSISTAGLTDEELLATATDVFVGRVVAVEWTEGAPRVIDRCLISQPRAHYQVEVLETVAGTAAGTIRVREGGGTRLRRELRDDDALLTAGETALFVVRHVPAFDRYSLVHGSRGRFRIRTDGERVALVARFATLVATPRPPTPVGTSRFGAPPAASAMPSPANRPRSSAGQVRPLPPAPARSP